MNGNSSVDNVSVRAGTADSVNSQPASLASPTSADSSSKNNIKGGPSSAAIPAAYSGTTPTPNHYNSGSHQHLQQQQQQYLDTHSGHQTQLASPYPISNRGPVWEFFRIIEYRVSGNTDRAECILCSKRMLGKSADMKKHIIMQCPNRENLDETQMTTWRKIRSELDNPKPRTKRSHAIISSSSLNSQQQQQQQQQPPPPPQSQPPSQPPLSQSSSSHTLAHTTSAPQVQQQRELTPHPPPWPTGSSFAGGPVNTWPNPTLIPPLSHPLHHHQQHHNTGSQFMPPSGRQGAMLPNSDPYGGGSSPTHMGGRHKYPRTMRHHHPHGGTGGSIDPPYISSSSDPEYPRFVNRLKMKLAQGIAAYGIWLDIPSPLTARIVSRLGFDWACVDMEHSPHSASVMAEMVAAIASSNVCTPIVRVPSHNIEWFKWALDAGAHGVIIPMVNTVEEMRKIVSHCKYPPEGTRSSGAFYAPYTYGFSNACANEYAAQANREILIIPQIESREAVDNVDDILSVPGIDAAFIGPYDLHLSLGLQPSGEGFEPEFIQALEKITQAARKSSVPLGIYCSSGEAARMRANQGFQMLVAVNDTMALLSASAEQLSKAKH